MGEIISRVWDMPSMHTFTIPAIKTLLRKYVKGKEWADPFAGFNSPATITNDLNPDAPTLEHMDAEAFMARMEDDSLDGVLFDPPYSPHQISEVYKSVGLEVGMKETQNSVLYRRVRDAMVPKIRPGGLAISFGWNSAGFGVVRGFERIETLLVNHGGAHNDTICVVERKGIPHPSLFDQVEDRAEMGPLTLKDQQDVFQKLINPCNCGQFLICPIHAEPKLREDLRA